MSKYEALWNYIAGCGKDSIQLSFEEIAQISGVPIDHSFLRYKKELIVHGFQLKKISMKAQTAAFERIPESAAEIDRIGFAEAADMDGWMALVRKLRASFPGLETEAALEAHRRTAMEFMDRREAICAKAAGEVVGALLFSKASSTLCFLAVDNAHRRQHIARQMFQMMLAQMTPGKAITLTSHREGAPEGEAARAFYQAMGFVPGRLTQEFGSPVQEFRLEAEAWQIS